MHFLKKTTAVLVCVLMLVSASACSSTDAADKIETVQVNSVLDRDATAATVGDEVITVGEVEDAYNEYVQMYSYYGQPVPTEDADIETVQDTVVEMLVKTQILTVKAKENGCDVLSEEQEGKKTQKDGKKSHHGNKDSSFHFTGSFSLIACNIFSAAMKSEA